MRKLEQLNIDESINQQKLIFKESWLDKLDAIAIYFFFTWAAILPFILYFDPHRDRTETGFIYYLLFLMTFFSVYVIYRKATDKKLIKISTNNNQEQNRTLINSYCLRENFEKHKDTKDLIIYNEDADFNINPEYKTSYIFVLSDNKVLFTILKERYKLNLPTLTKHLVVKADLKKLLNDNSQLVQE